MPRPTLVIGLGGTGQWVLTWLKRDLILANNGKMPNNVVLLEVDTATRLEAGTKRTNAAGREEQAAVVGDITLQESEFIYVGGDLRELAEQVAAGEFKQLNWFQATRWLKTQMPATFVLDDGAGRLRQFGRFSIFKDLLSQNRSKIRRALYTALTSVQGATDSKRRLEIIVVGSFAGGTGSGLFIDISLILRMLANQLNIHHVMRGFFALPSVFTDSADSEMLARCFAAWRELNRFMVVDMDYPMPVIEYVENNPDYRIRPDRRLFDACYLIEGSREGNRLPQEAKFGVFPMMSEVISAIMDEKAGSAYTEWIFTNLAPEYAKKPETPMYSAVGAFTVQVPVYFVQERSSQLYARELLKRLLVPSQEPDSDGRLTMAGAERHLALSRPDHNLEDQGFAGRRRSLTVFNSIEREGMVKATRFHGRIADIYDRAVNQGQQATVVSQMARFWSQARQTGGSASNQAWVSSFPDLGGDPTYEAVKKKLDEFMNFHIPTEYGRKENEKGSEVRLKALKIPDDIRTRFGGMTSVLGGEGMEDYYGRCGEELEKCKEAQLALFRKLVKGHTLDILMGRSPDPLVARTGKLGYVFDYLDGAVEIMDKFLEIMDLVRKERDAAKPELKLADAAKRSQDYMKSMSDRKFLLFFEHPDVKRSEDVFLADQQRLMEVRREEILHIFVLNTAREMRRILAETRDAVQRWIWHLSTGDETTSIPGLWENVRQDIRRAESAHSFDMTAQGVQKVLADEALDFSEEDLRKALGQWQWQVEFEGNRPCISALILPDDPNGKTALLQDPLIMTSAEQRQKLGRQNQMELMRLADRRFTGVVAKSTVAEAIRQKYPDPEKLAIEIGAHAADPLFVAGTQSSPRVQSNLIRVMVSDKDDYFTGPEGFEGYLRGLSGVPRDKRWEKFAIQVVGSENPYKLTLVRTDDLYEYTHFKAWSECLKGYAAHADPTAVDKLDPVLMQNFAAEERAVAYERRLSKGVTYRPLHPRVVMLLEDPEALRQFIFLGMLGMISDVDSHEGYRWELNWEVKSGNRTINQSFWLTKAWQRDIDEGKKPQPDFLHAIHGYVIMKINQQTGRTDRIDTGIARQVIQREMDKLQVHIEANGSSALVNLVKANLQDPDGLVCMLRDMSLNPMKQDEIERQDYADLAEVVRMILEDKLSDLTQSEEASGGDSGGRRSMFKRPGQSAAQSDHSSDGLEETFPSDDSGEPPATRRRIGKRQE